MHLSRLRLYGFKSFADKTEVEITPGLNGIVGPNGCGKSNLVEAMRWVMGGASAKNFRAEDMNDVIFAGTAKRPARNIAEVSLLLDNTDNTAPHPFQNIAQIEVTRRIERDKGSTYLVNGKTVRARDVAMLFADALTGASSPALVSQGKVAQLIGAKPSERRQVLEEAAGVSALFSRRHEAQLRLKAASENLAKLDDVLRDIDNRTASLRRQAKQAERYTELNTTINQHDMALLWYGWRDAREQVKSAESAFEAAETAVREALTEQARLNTESAMPLEALPALREAEVKARAALQKLRQTADQLTQQSEQRRKGIADLRDQITRVDADIAYTAQQQTTAKTQQKNIETDLAAVLEQIETLPAQLAETNELLTKAQDAVAQYEGSVFALSSEKRSMEQDAARHQSALENAAKRIAQLRTNLDATNTQITALEGQGDNTAELETAQAERTRIADALTAAEQMLEVQQTALDAAKSAVDAANAEHAALQAKSRHIGSEIDAVERSLAGLSKSAGNGLLMDASVTAGYEFALSRAAGCAGMKADVLNGVCRWNDAAVDAAPFDPGVQTLADFVRGDARLNAFLRSVAVIENTQQKPALKNGQMAVTKDGWLYRWDGLTITPDHREDESHTILQYKTRLTALRGERDAVASDAAAKTDTLNETQSARGAAQNTLNETQQNLRTLRGQLSAMDTRIGQMQSRVMKLAGERATLTERARSLTSDLDTATTEHTLLQSSVNAGETAARLKLVLETLESSARALDTARADRSALQTKAATLNAENAAITRRKAGLEQERIALFDRLHAQETRGNELATRKTELSGRLSALESEDALDNADIVLDGLRTRIVDAEKIATDAADALTTTEQKLGAVNAALRAADEAAATAREKRGAASAGVTAARDKLALSIADIDGRFAMEPATLESEVAALFANGIPSKSACKSVRDDASRSRDAIGPVNLRAAEELAELEGQHGTIIHERGDLAAAIDRLQDAISKLNSEARDRLQTAYTTINETFQSLFQRLFAGGEARLQLVGDDILDAGLEIYAQPPGKALQSLSLLSGGEQALTALTLIFAMFACNPAPVCVLDEVDAPLDDANIERVCNLLEEMSRRFTTRFLVISHHRLTMARMQRLYGVTMAERGVSQLVGVDLDVLTKMAKDRTHVAA